MKKLTFLLIFSFLFANINEAIEEFKQKNYKLLPLIIFLFCCLSSTISGLLEIPCQSR